jgi:hypothetical protein
MSNATLARGLLNLQISNFRWPSPIEALRHMFRNPLTMLHDTRTIYLAMPCGLGFSGYDFTTLYTL